MKTLVRLAVYSFVAWTFFHLWEMFRDHTVTCDGCGHQPWSEAWVVVLRLASWGFAAAAMLFLPTPPYYEGGEQA